MNCVLLILCAAVLSAILTAGAIPLSLRLDWIAPPRGDRWHKRATPNTGGLAIALSCVALYAAIAPRSYGLIASAAAGIALLGFADDRIPLKPWVKLAGQSIAAGAVVAGGVIFHATPWSAPNALFTMLWIVGITNAFNLIDNMDGLCAGVTVIVAGFRVWSALRSGDQAGAALCALLGGSYLGFLVFNFRPARIFMGDCGSMFAGFSLGALAIASPLPNTRIFVSALSPALTFLFPIFDTVLVSCLRRAAGVPVYRGGRDHSSHRLASLGLSDAKVVLLLWVLTAAGGLAGDLTYGRPVAVLAAGAACLFLLIGFGRFLASVPPEAARKPASDSVPAGAGRF